jgi:hypothetical protein
MSVRGDLAAALAAAVATDFPAIEVYGTPEDVTQLPAIVLAPGDPWVEPSSMGQGGNRTYKWSYVVQLCVLRADPRSALDNLEALWFLMVDGAGTLGGSTRALGGPAMVELAGIQALVAECEVELMTTRKA